MQEEIHDPVRIYIDRLEHIAKYGSVEYLARSAGVSRQTLHSRAMKRLKEICPGGTTSIQGGGNAPGDQGETATIIPQETKNEAL